MPAHELRFYAAQGRLTVAFTATPNIVKSQLEQAGDHATFNRFTDLPPEIRQMVYQHYFNYSLANDEPKYKYQPPLTKVSRMIRRESLSLFYDSFNIEITSLGPLTAPYKFHPSATTARLLQSTASQNLARIKYIRLWFMDLSAGLAIDLRNQDPIGDVDVYRAGWSKANGASGARRQPLLAALRDLVLSVAARPGPLRFRLTDVDEVGETMRRIIIDEDEKAAQ